MLTIDLKENTLNEILNGLHTSSKLEEMLSLMSEDGKITEINVSSQQLFKEQNHKNEPVKSWRLTTEELTEFATQFKNEITAKTGQELENEALLVLEFKDSRVILTGPPVSQDYSLQVRKLYNWVTTLDSLMTLNAGTGKTTTSAAMLAEYLVPAILSDGRPKAGRIITIEDSAEMVLPR